MAARFQPQWLGEGQMDGLLGLDVDSLDSPNRGAGAEIGGVSSGVVGSTKGPSCGIGKVIQRERRDFECAMRRDNGVITVKALDPKQLRVTAEVHVLRRVNLIRHIAPPYRFYNLDIIIFSETYRTNLESAKKFLI